MADFESEVELIRRLLSAVDGIAASPDVSEEIKGFAQTVKVKYEALRNEMGEGGFLELGSSIRLAETLEEQLRTALSQRRNAEIGAVVGNAARIVGTLVPSQPAGDAMFWAGLAVSCVCDAIAESAGHEAKELAQQLQQLLANHEGRLRASAKAVRDLDEALEAHTGWSLYDDKLRAFLDQASKDPESAEEHAACAGVDGEEKANLVAIARDRSVVKILKTAFEYAMKEDIAILTVLCRGLNALSFLKMSPAKSAALQVGEISLRGVILLIEYKRNSKTLSQFAKGIALMKKEYEVLEVIYGKSKLVEDNREKIK